MFRRCVGPVADDHRSERTLAILPPDENQALTVSPCSNGALPTKQIPDDRLLPALEQKRLAGLRALALEKLTLNEPDCVAGGGTIGDLDLRERFGESLQCFFRRVETAPQPLHFQSDVTNAATSPPP